MFEGLCLLKDECTLMINPEIELVTDLPRKFPFSLHNARIGRTIYNGQIKCNVWIFESLNKILYVFFFISSTFENENSM